MSDRLHPATRALISAKAGSTARDLALALAAAPPPDWNNREWLTIAAAADTSARADSVWHVVQIVAYEHWDDRSAPLRALEARARFLVRAGPDERDSFQSLQAFIERVDAFIAGETPDHALQEYRAAHHLLVTTEQGQPEWNDARDVFLRCRQLRSLARVLDALEAGGTTLPERLSRWSPWARLREDELSR